MSASPDSFDAAFTKAVDLGNKLADKNPDSDIWDIADGLLAGALQYWLVFAAALWRPGLRGLLLHQHRPRPAWPLGFGCVQELATDRRCTSTSPTDSDAGRA
jgi:hypothetical protein